MKRFLSFWRELFASKPTLPVATSTVKGFSVQIVRKEGCVFRTRPRDAPEGTPYTDSGVNWHFEVTITTTGENHDYPDAKGPWTFLLTNSLREEGCGITGSGLIYQAPGDEFTRVEVIEKEEDYKNCEFLPWGRRPKPATVVSVKVYSKTSRGDDTGVWGIGIASRPLISR